MALRLRTPQPRFAPYVNALAQGTRYAYRNYDNIANVGRSFRTAWSRINAAAPRVARRGLSRVAASSMPYVARGAVSRRKSRAPRVRRRMNKKASKKWRQKIYAIANPCKQLSSVRSETSGVLDLTINQPKYYEVAFMKKTDTLAKLAKAVQYFQASASSIRLEAPFVDTNDVWTSKLKSAVMTMRIRNNGDLPVKLEINWYRCIANHDVAVVNCWTADMVARAADSDAVSADVFKNSYLYNIREKVGMCKGSLETNWRRTKMKTITLQPKGVYTFKIKRTNPYGISKTQLDAIDAGSYIKGITQNVVIRCTGDVAHDNTNTALVGYGNGILDWVQTQRWDFNVSTDQRAYKNYVIDDTDTLDTVVDPDMKVGDTDMAGIADA